MKNERKQRLTNFALSIAKGELEKQEDIMFELSKIHPTFQELIMLDDLVQDFMKKIEKGEIK